MTPGLAAQPGGRGCGTLKEVCASPFEFLTLTTLKGLGSEDDYHQNFLREIVSRIAREHLLSKNPECISAHMLACLGLSFACRTFQLSMLVDVRSERKESPLL